MVEGIPQSPRELLDLLERSNSGLGLDDYVGFSKELPAEAMTAVGAAWGKAEEEARLGRGTPSVLPDISPARGEIGSFALAALLATLDDWRRQ